MGSYLVFVLVALLRTFACVLIVATEDRSAHEPNHAVAGWIDYLSYGALVTPRLLPTRRWLSTRKHPRSSPRALPALSPSFRASTRLELHPRPSRW